MEELKFELHKQQTEDYIKLVKKIVKFLPLDNYQKLNKQLVKLLPTETLIDELKRRKIIKFDWNKDKFVEVSNEN